MSIFNDVDNIKTDSDVNNELLSRIYGLSYYEDFISVEEEEYILEYLSNIEYIKESGKLVKYYGYNYRYNTKKCDINNKIIDIPEELNIIFNKIGVEYNQLVIEKIPVDKTYKFPIHSNIFSNNITTLSIGSNVVSEFRNILTDDKIDILINRRSLMILSDISRKEYVYKVNNKKIQIFNNKKVIRNSRYVLTFKNIKFIDKIDNGDVYYFSY